MKTDRTLRFLRYLMLAINGAVILSLLYSIGLVYVYSPITSWLAGHPYQYHNWVHVITKFLPVYLIALAASGYAFYFLYTIPRHATR